MKVYALRIRNRFVALGLAVIGFAVLAVVLVTGAAVLLILALAGAVLAAGMGLYYRLRGGRRPGRHIGERRPDGLDPSLEVFPEPRDSSELPPPRD